MAVKKVKKSYRKQAKRAVYILKNKKRDKQIYHSHRKQVNNNLAGSLRLQSQKKK